MATKLNVSLVSSYDLSANTTDDVGVNNLTNSGISFTGTDIFAADAVLDGVADTAEIADVSQTGMDAGTGSFSLEIWAYPALTTGMFAIGKRGGGGGNDTGYQIVFGDVAGPKIRFYISDGTDSASMTTTANYSVNTKYHVVGVVNRTLQLGYIYVNGSLAATAVDVTSVDSVSNANPFAIGYHASLASTYYQGQLGRGRLWVGRALTADEVSTLYNAGSGLTYAQLSQYPLDPASGGKQVACGVI